MELVSVVIPVYNAEKYLEETLKNLVSQTYENLEIIVIDDGSEDDSYRILNRFAGLDVRIKGIKKQNQGPGAARNLGMKLAAGKYIIFLDADDHVEENMIELLAEAMEQEQADFAMCRAYAYDEGYDRKRTFAIALNENILKGKSFFCPKEVYGELFQVTGGFVWNKLFRTDFLRTNQIEFADTCIYEDMFVTMQSLMTARKIALVNKELITYRTNNQESLSIRSMGKSSRWREMAKVFEEMNQKISAKNLSDKLEKTFLNRLAESLYSEFTGYTQESAVVGLYDYYKNRLIVYFNGKDENFFYKSKLGKMIEFLNGSSSAIGFLLSLERYRTRQFLNRLNLLKEQNCRLARQKQIKHWLFPFGEIPHQSKVILYGAGQVGQDYYEQIQTTGWCRVVQWVDRQAKAGIGQGLPVEDLGRLNHGQADYIVICISDQKTAEEMKGYLQQAGADDKQIVTPRFIGESKWI